MTPQAGAGLEAIQDRHDSPSKAGGMNRTPLEFVEIGEAKVEALTPASVPRQTWLCQAMTYRGKCNNLSVARFVLPTRNIDCCGIHARKGRRHGVLEVAR